MTAAAGNHRTALPNRIHKSICKIGGQKRHVGRYGQNRTAALVTSEAKCGYKAAKRALNFWIVSNNGDLDVPDLRLVADSDGAAL